MKDILKIVITGGPCAGKTTALDKLDKALHEDGDTVIFVNETATELIQQGMRPFGDEKDRLELIDFQRLILKVQLDKEEARLKAAERVKNEYVSILHDRGASDNGAYLDDKEFEQILEEKRVTKEELLGRYDLVIHLVSTAIDKEECYVNSAERKETPQEARRLDARTVRMWSKHPNLIVLFNDGTAEEKVEMVIKVIRYFKKYRTLAKEYETNFLPNFQGWIREQLQEEKQKIYQKR